MSKEFDRFICGDALAELRKLPAGSIDMCLTSPPYWGLRDYGIGPDQLGLEPTPELYIKNLTEIFNEVKRVLKKEGTLWLNIGDTYGGSGQGSQTGYGDYKRQRVIGTMEKSITNKFMPKCLCMIPERLSWSLIQDGWILRNKIIWYKPNAMPSSVKDRFSNRWEYLFMFSKNSKPTYWTNIKTLKLVTKQPAGIKGIEEVDWKWERCPRCEGCGEITKEAEKGPKKCSRCNGLGEIKMSFWTAHDYYFDLDAVREPHKYDGRKDTLYKGGPKDMQIGKHERWPDAAGKNPGDVFEVGAETRTMGAIIGSGGGVKVPGGKGWTGHPPGGEHRIKHDPRWCPPEGKNPGDFWEINTQPFPEAHFAVFPEKLCEKPIKAGCPEEVCKKCRKARERIVESESFTTRPAKSGKDTEHKIYSGSPERFMSKKIGEYWTSCDCNAGFEGGIVLDPFCGAGTVGVVAKKMARRFILIDIKEEYMKMAKRRVAQVGHQKELFK